MATTMAAVTRSSAGGVRNSSTLSSVRTSRTTVATRQTRALAKEQNHFSARQQRRFRYAELGYACRSVAEDIEGASIDEEADEAAAKPDRVAPVEEIAGDVAAEVVADIEAAPEKSARKGRQKGKRHNNRSEAGDIITDVPFKVGDLVQGKVIFSNYNGARVEVLCGVPGVIGYMMFNAGPHSINQEGKGSKRHEIGPFRVPSGLVREFKVLNIPDEMRENGVGPLLSAKAADEDILWSRLDQMSNACQHENSNFELQITGTNKGGIRSRLQGMSLFVPYSFMPKCPVDSRWSEEAANDIYLTKNVEVALVDVDRESQRLVGSLNKADSNRTLKFVYPGALVQGTIRKLEGFGAFVGIDNTNMSALLHVSNVSQGHLDHVSSIFEIGDRVTCIVTEMENDGTRVSISTKELEMYRGEMIDDREAVMSNAEQRYAEYLEYEGYE